MGATKALLDLDGRTALARVVALGAGTIDADVVVVGHDRERVADEARRLGAVAIENPAWREGQTGSLQAGLRHALDDGATHCVVHPVDLPLVTPATYAACLDDFAGHEITVPSHDMRRGHPLIVTAAVAGEILALDEDTGARAVIHRHADRIRHVAVDDPWVLRDLDHPEDLEAARAHLRRT